MKYISIFILFISLVSCNDSLIGKIENRKDNNACQGSTEQFFANEKLKDRISAYLINTSKEKAYEFTIKETTIINDSITKYNTKKIELSPGDEKRLGCIEWMDFNIELSTKDNPVKEFYKVKFECTGQRHITSLKED